MLSYHIAQLAAFCSAHPVRPKVLFVPAPQAGYNLATALAASGHPWVNLHVATPADWADRTVGPQLQGEGRRPLPADADRFFLDGLVARALKRVPETPFADRMGPGLARSFLRTLRSLRLAGVAPERLDRSGSPRARLLSALCLEYAAFLEAERYYDRAILYERAIRAAAQADGAAYAVLDETPLPGLAFRYLETLARGNLCRIGRPDPGVPPPAHSAAARFPDAPFPDAEGRVAPAAGLFTDGLSPEDGRTFALREALGAENEVRAALREILHGDIPLDAVEIAYTAEIPYLPLLRDAVERFDFPAAFAEGVPLHLTRPGQALLGFYRWAATGLDAAEIVGLCRAGLLAFDRCLPPGEAPQPEQVALILRRERVGQGREQYRKAFERLRDGYRERRERLLSEDRSTAHLDAERAALDRVRSAIEALLALLPEGARVPANALADAGLTFLRRFAPARAEVDAAALESLTERLESIGRAVSLADTPARLAQRFADILSRHTVETTAAHPGYLHIAPLDRAGYTNRKHLYILGMDESAFPGGAAEDPILLDAERAALSADLALHRTRPAEQVWHLARILGRAPGPVTLLASRRSLADGRETYPSALFQQAQAQLGAGPLEPVSSVPPPGLALDDTEALLAARNAAGYADAVRSAFPHLARGEAAERARERSELTRFDGLLGRPTPELDPTTGRTVISASRLEALARCPYRHFLKYVLQVEPPDDPDEDPGRWLSPLDFGALLHSLFHGFMQALQARGEAPDLDRHAALLDDMLREHVERYREHTPVAHEAAHRADLKRLKQAARAFLAAESRRQEVEPVGFEISFGFGETGGLNRPEPVTLALSDRVRLRLRGRIDRVDRVREEYEIWDYKTGSMAGYDAENLLKRGIHLQWALYAYALEQVLRGREHPGRIFRSGYFFTSDREHGRRIGAAPPDPADLAGLLAPLFDLVRRGCFPHVQKENQCAFCDYNRICATEAVLPKDLKEVNAANPDKPDLLNLINRWMNV